MNTKELDPLVPPSLVHSGESGASSDRPLTPSTACECNLLSVIGSRADKLATFSISTSMQSQILRGERYHGLAHNRIGHYR